MGDRVILHSDINCCYASIEHLHHPELAGKPLAVGGDPEARHGIVLTADYIAKKYGVKTGMALWQAKQVAKGDYSQTVSYLGEFSEAFNTMTKQLREREMILERKAEAEKRHAEMAESYNQLLMELIARSEEEILVTSLDGQEVFYCNRAVDVKKRGIYRICMEQTARIADGEHDQLESYEWDWEAEDSENRFYRITTGMMKWQGRKAYTHIIQEVTVASRMR